MAERNDCPKCSGCSTVLEARFNKNLPYHHKRVEGINCTRRRRQCQECGHRWTTYEIEHSAMAVLLGSSVARREELMNLITDFVGKVKAFDLDNELI